MDNAAKALYIAGSLLIALLVISLMVYTFNNLGGVQKQKDEIEYEESVSDFNKEYEAFNKKIMYGVDVISCINKAVSNNEKYVKGGDWAISGASGVEALVQVEVSCGDLKESAEIYYYNLDDKKERQLFDWKNIKDFQTMTLKKLLEDHKVDINLDDILSNYKESTVYELLNNNSGSQNTTQPYKLLDDTGGKIRKKFKKGETSLFLLTENASNPEIIIKNDKDKWDVWSTIKWTTCLADFKKKKFGCSKIEYNNDTGFVEKIVFEEK